MKNKPIVCYLFTIFDKIEYIKNFRDYYLKFNAGIDHDLIICFKLLDSNQINNIINELSDIKFYNFVDPHNKNDFDFGSYKRIAEIHYDKQILFMNSHSYPICDNWLLKLINHSSHNSLIGTSASNESILFSIKLKKYYKIFSYLLKKFLFNKKFNSFPNPHIRTSSFLVNGQVFFDYIKDIKIQNKVNTWEIESGKKSLTNFFKSKNYNIYVVNSDGKKFTEKNYIYSETYCYSKQSKSIISDKHTRKYLSLSHEDKNLSQFKVWGK